MQTAASQAIHDRSMATYGINFTAKCSIQEDQLHKVLQCYRLANYDRSSR